MMQIDLKNSLLAVTAGLTALGWPTASHAQFTGQTIEIAHVYPNTSTLFTNLGLPATRVVGPAVELANYGSALDFDLADDRISITISAGVSISQGDVSASSFSGYRFRDILGTVPAITGVSVNGLTTLPGFNSGRLSFDADQISINLEGLSTGAAARSVVLDVVFAPVPEPGTLALMLGGAAALGALARRRRAA